MIRSRGSLLFLLVALMIVCTSFSGGCGGSSDGGSPSDSQDITPPLSNDINSNTPDSDDASPSPVASEDTAPNIPESSDTTPAEEPVISGRFRVSAGRYKNIGETSDHSFQSTTPAEFELILTKNNDGETYTAVLSGDNVTNSGTPTSYINCTFSGGITQQLYIGGSNYVYELDEDKDCYNTGNYHDTPAEGETAKEISIKTDNGDIGFKYSIPSDENENGSREWHDLLEVGFERIN